VLSQCANPACAKEFDHRHGRFFRFPRNTREGEPPANTHSVQHFWLCGYCSEVYTLSYRTDCGIVMTEPFAKPSRGETPRLIAVA
jgi:hypothetical protein